MNTTIAVLLLSVTASIAQVDPNTIQTGSLLRAKLSSPEFETRRQAAIDLHGLGDNSGVPVLIDAMTNLTIQRERDNAIVALRVTEDPRSIPVLIKMTSDRSAYVRGIALAALGELAAANAYDAIVSHLNDFENSGGCIPMYPGGSACYALGALGDQKAIPLLVNALDHPETQGQACQALEKLTGQPFRYDVEKWKSWWKENEPNKPRHSNPH